MTRNTRVITPELAPQEAEACLSSFCPPLFMSSALTQCSRVRIDMAYGVRADWLCGEVFRLPVIEVISWVPRIYASIVKSNHVTLVSVHLSALLRSLSGFGCPKCWEEVRTCTQGLGNFLSRMARNIIRD